jgi:hypothetical protein
MRKIVSPVRREVEAPTPPQPAAAPARRSSAELPPAMDRRWVIFDKPVRRLDTARTRAP